MTLLLNATAIASDHSAHTARRSPGWTGWGVSWLPDQVMDRNTAVTAMTLPDAAAEHHLHDRRQLWPHIQSWAGELGLSAPQAIFMASQPLPGTGYQREPVGQPPAREAAD